MKKAKALLAAGLITFCLASSISAEIVPFPTRPLQSGVVTGAASNEDAVEPSVLDVLLSDVIAFVVL